MRTDVSLSLFKKSKTTTETYHNQFLKNIKKYQTYTHIYVDAGVWDSTYFLAIVLPSDFWIDAFFLSYPTLQFNLYNNEDTTFKVLIIVMPNQDHKISTAELFAIQFAVFISQLKINKKILILSDSLTSAKYMSNFFVGENIVLMWIPAHRYILGNEIADSCVKLAKTLFNDVF